MVSRKLLRKPPVLWEPNSLHVLAPISAKISVRNRKPVTQGSATEVKWAKFPVGSQSLVVACLSGQGLLECPPACWPPFVDGMHDLKEALSALIYTLTAKDIKIRANVPLTLLQINLGTALGKFESIKRFCQFVWKQFLFCSVSRVTPHAIVLF